MARSFQRVKENMVLPTLSTECILRAKTNQVRFILLPELAIVEHLRLPPNLILELPELSFREVGEQ